MKVKYILSVFLILVLYKIQAQEKLKISPYAGINQTTGKFKDFTKSTGFDYGISLDYVISKKVSFGLDVNQQNNDFKNPFDYTRIPENNFYSLTSFETGTWNTTTIGVGPTYSFGSNKFLIDIYSKAGVSIVKTPNSADIFNFNGVETEIFKLAEQNKTSFGITSGIRFNYSLNDKLSIYLNPQYVYSSAKIQYSYRDINPSFIDTEFNPGLLVEQPLETKEVNPSYLNLNFGLTFKLGEKRTKTNEQEDLNQNCLKTALQSPKNNDKYLLDSDIKPVFSWVNYSNSVKDYEFRLYQGENLIYTKNTKSTSLEVGKKLQKYFNNQLKEQTFNWEIKTTYKDCPDQFTPKQTFSIRASNTIEINVTDIECLTPAYDSNGNVRYKAKVEFKTGNNSSQWNINSLSLIESATTIPISTLNNCAIPFAVSPVAPLVLAPNSSSVWCFEFSVPIGSLNQTFQANGTLGNGSGDVSVLNSLPSCVCNICDENNPDGWQIIPSNENFWEFNFNGGLSNMRIGTSFQILNADPIQKVKAEIISVQHIVNDTLCYSCTKEDNTMGLFHKSNSSGLLVSGNGWQNNGVGTLFDDNNDSYGNEFTWKASTSQGVDFNTSKRFLMNMNLPPIPSLECCETKYKVCVRYTFEDINCQTCDYLVCYDYDSSISINGSGTGIGGVGTGTGNQSGGVLTPTQLTPKN